MSHRGYPGGHHAEVAFFTGVAPEGVRDMGDIRNSISLDQEAAEHIGAATRFPCSCSPLETPWTIASPGSTPVRTTT